MKNRNNLFENASQRLSNAELLLSMTEEYLYESSVHYQKKIDTAGAMIGKVMQDIKIIDCILKSLNR